jgi:hypothetical protein
LNQIYTITNCCLLSAIFCTWILTTRNADTNELICNATARYGTSATGTPPSSPPLSPPPSAYISSLSATELYNEANYVALSPCLWGDQPGLQKAPTLTPDTKIKAIKFFNNTYRHLGQMAQWTGLIVYEGAEHQV